MGNNYNIQMKYRNSGNTDWDNLYPITSSNNVLMADGTTPVETAIANCLQYANVSAGKKIKIVACVLRNDGSGWACINDTGHEPINVLSVGKASGYDHILEVDFGFTASKILSFVACPDETYAHIGLSCGASVMTNKAQIEMSYMTPSAYAYINNSSGSVAINSTFADGNISSAVWDNGVLKVYYPQIAPYEIPQILSKNPAVDAYLSSITTDHIEITFVKKSTNTVITTPSAGDVAVWVSKPSLLRKITDINTLNNSNGNIWCLGIFEV